MGFLDFLNPVSAVTGLIGGIQGSSAAHDAAAAQVAGYGQAAGSVNNAVNNANPIIKGAAQTASSGLTSAAQTAGTGAIGAAQVAGQGVTGATQAAQAGIGSAYGQAANLVNPYIQTGAQANSELQALTAPGADVTQVLQQLDPGYQFRLSQGLQGVQQSQAANGLLNSGATLRALQNYGQNYASSEYQNTYARLAGLAGMGLGAGQTLGAQGLGAATTSGQFGIGGAQYAGNTGINAAQYAGNLGYGAAGQSGQWGVNAGNLQASNLINAGVYQGNTQIGAGNAQAAGDIGAANAWNGALGTIGNSFGFGGSPNPYLQYGYGSPVGTSPMGGVNMGDILATQGAGGFA